jgi:DNA-directed RNA polymerase specialized sigma24 family protein
MPRLSKGQSQRGTEDEVNNAVCEAVALVQGFSCHYESRSHHVTECCEEALNDLVRNPARSGEPIDLVHTAMRNARKKLRRRSDVATIKAATPLIDDDRGLFGVVAPPALFEEPAWLGALSPSARRLVALDSLGFTRDEIAADADVSKSQLYVLLSRARAAARESYLTEAA